MIKNWRAWVLLVLLVGPILAYIGFGALWLKEQGWLLTAFTVWVTAGILFSFLAARWTKSNQPILPPIDWDAPQTFSPRDRTAWALVEEEAERGESYTMEQLSGVDVYIDTGRRLTRRLAEHYHPFSENPIDHVPIIELLTALELAADDLGHLCRQVPGGDLITPAHWKRAVQAAGYIQMANDIYSYLLPIVNPVTGLVRLGTQQWMVKPAWKNMQQNLLRWFFRAFVNRLGAHLVELYSGRLAIGAEQYRRLTRKSARQAAVFATEPSTLTIAVAGARDSGKSRLIQTLEQARAADPTLLKARLTADGYDPAILERLAAIRWVEVPGYTANAAGETARDRSTRREAVEQAVDCDLLILVIDGRRDQHAGDLSFAQAWDRWYLEHPGLEPPPALAVVSGVDRPEFGGEWKPPYNWTKGERPRELAVRARLESLRASLPPTFTQIVAAGLSAESPFGVTESLLPALVALLHRAERTALLRHFHRVSSRSKAQRLLTQVGEHGRSLWKNLRSGRSSRKSAEATEV